MSIDINKVNALVQAMKDVFENKQTNKKTDISGDYSSDTVSYPTVQAVKSWVGNKVTSWSSTTSDDNYPSEKLVKDSLDAKASSTHTHGNIDKDGKIGSTANKPVITTTGGAVTTGSFGTSANTFCEGNDSRLSDARTPTSHNQASSTITDTNTYTNIGNSSGTQESINSAINSKLGEIVDINFVTVVSELPTASSSTMGKIYLVAISGSGSNNYAEYVTVRSGTSPNYSYNWEKFGEVSGSGLSVDWGDITNKPSSYTPASHTHGDITNDGKIGSTSGKPIITTTGGKLTTGAFGTSSGQFAEGNHTHSGYISTSSTAGLVKNDGSIDTTTYLSSLPSHTHGNLTNDGKVGSNANYIVVTTTGGAITSVQKLGNITYDGKIGSTSGLPIITTTSGKLTTGSFGSTSGTFAEGNHTHSTYTTSSDVDSQIDAALDAITTALSS